MRILKKNCRDAPKDGTVGNKGAHIHFVVNTVNFMTGKKWHTNFRQSYNREQDFNRNIIDTVCERVIEPLEFTRVFLDII